MCFCLAQYLMMNAIMNFLLLIFQMPLDPKFTVKSSGGDTPRPYDVFTSGDVGEGFTPSRRKVYPPAEKSGSTPTTIQRFFLTSQA